MAIQFSTTAESKFQKILSGYPRKDAALLPVLWLAQDEFEYLSEEVRDYVAEKLDLSRARVDSVVSFYTMYNTKKVGKFHLQVCRGISCYLRDCKSVMNGIEEELKVKNGETTSDGMFTYNHVECLGNCGNAPTLQVNVEKFNENLNHASVRQLIGDLRHGKNPK
jgi:NADH-quinone oxidoreductase subunit E